MKPRAILPLVLLGVSAPTLADVTLSPYWTDHAVIQRGKPIMVKGHAGAGEQVTGVLANGKPVTRVRYGWADSPVVNAYDHRELPRPGFELPISH